MRLGSLIWTRANSLHGGHCPTRTWPIRCCLMNPTIDFLSPPASRQGSSFLIPTQVKLWLPSRASVSTVTCRLISHVKRIYVTGSETASVFEQHDADHYEHIAEVPTAYRAKSSIFVPDLKRLYVAVSGKGKPDAKLELRIYEAQ